MKIIVMKQVTYEGYTFKPGVWDCAPGVGEALLHSFPQKVKRWTPQEENDPQEKPKRGRKA